MPLLSRATDLAVEMGNEEVHIKHVLLALLSPSPPTQSASDLRQAGLEESSLREQMERERSRGVPLPPQLTRDVHEVLAWCDGLRAARPDISVEDAALCACLIGPKDAIELWFRQAGGDPDVARSLMSNRLGLPSLVERYRPRWSEWRSMAKNDFDELRRALKADGVRYRFGSKDDRVMVSFDEGARRTERSLGEAS